MEGPGPSSGLLSAVTLDQRARWGVGRKALKLKRQEERDRNDMEDWGERTEDREI